MSQLISGEHATMQGMAFTATLTNMIVYLIMLVAALSYAGQGAYHFARFVRSNLDLRERKTDT